MRSCKPDPFAANIVHVGENRCDGANSRTGRGFCPPRRGVKMLNEHLVDEVVEEEELRGRALESSAPELPVNLGSARFQSSPRSMVLAQIRVTFRARRYVIATHK